MREPDVAYDPPLHRAARHAKYRPDFTPLMVLPSAPLAQPVRDASRPCDVCGATFQLPPHSPFPPRADGFASVPSFVD